MGAVGWVAFSLQLGIILGTRAEGGFCSVLAFWDTCLQLCLRVLGHPGVCHPHHSGSTRHIFHLSSESSADKGKPTYVPGSPFPGRAMQFSALFLEDFYRL